MLTVLTVFSTLVWIPDHPGSSSAFMAKGNLNTPYSKARPRTTQAATVTARGFWANL